MVAVAFWLFSYKNGNKKSDNQQVESQNTSNNFNDNVNNSVPEVTEHFDHLDRYGDLFNDSEESENNVAANDLSPNFNQQPVDSSPKQEKLLKNDGFKAANFKDGERGAKSDNLDKFFEGSYPRNSKDNNGFSPMVENDIGAAYAPGNAEKLSDKDKFNPDSLLPKEKNTEWADDPYEQVNVKSSTLSAANANIFRPTGLNTVQSTKKIAFHDLRAIPKAPKLNVSPWGMSSYEGDNNIRNDSLCA